MAKKQISIGRLNEILDNTISSITESKDEVVEIVNFSRQECKRLEEELTLTKIKTQEIINIVEKLEILDKKSRVDLLEKSKDFTIYNEDQMKDAYERAHKIRLDLSIKKEEEKNLMDRRNELELSLKNSYDVYYKAENLSKQIAVATEYLLGNAESIIETVDELSKKHLLGIRIIEGQEEERHRLARDMHDGPAQSLANLVVKAELCEKLLDKDLERARLELGSLKSLTKTTLNEVRKVIYDLRPMSLDDLGLIPTLERYISNFEDDTSIKIKLQVLGSFNNIEPTILIALFRITQESLSNIRKHSQAKTGTIIIEETGKRINLSIADDGLGFDVDLSKNIDPIKSGYGLFSIRERVDLLNGKLTLSSIKGKGTKISLFIPLDEGDN